MIAKSKIRLNFKLDVNALADTLADHMTAADISGRIHVLERAARKVQVNPMGRLAVSGFAESAVGSRQSAEFLELLGFESVKPTESADFIRSLTSFTRAAWAKLRPLYRQAAFTISKVENIKLLDRVKDLLADSLTDGMTRSELEAAIREAFDTAGVTKLNPYHLDTMIQTNLQTAYMNGRIKQMADPDVKLALPYWRYRTMEDELVRPNHAALDGFVAHANDPIWGRITPPNGFNCRCETEPLGRGEAAEILGGQINTPGADRLPPRGGPDAGFEKSPAGFLRGLAAGNLFRRRRDAFRRT